ncbi:MAG: hypothetical protein HYT16_01115 [DPANN group archaeon]|nr:hypothetical protein [DPANN group archaeon]
MSETMIAKEVQAAGSQNGGVTVKPLSPKDFYRNICRLAARKDKDIEDRVAVNLAELLECGGERLTEQFELLKLYSDLERETKGEPSRKQMEETDQPNELELMITTDAALRTLGMQNQSYPADGDGFYCYTEEMRRSARFFLEASWVRKQLYVGAEEFLQAYEMARARLAGKGDELARLLGEAAKAGQPTGAKNKLDEFLAGLPHPEGMVLNYSERQFVLPVVGGVYATTIPNRFSLHLVSRGGIKQIDCGKFDSFLAAYLKYVEK